MYTLRLLGGIGLSDAAGQEVDALLRQPKHIALLAYLALPRPGTWHRRDSVLATFWPENDQVRARSALRSALYTIRRHLPEQVIISRGDDELSLDVTMIGTDVAAMSDALTEGRFEEALARYKGELLPGLYIPGAEGFDKWLEQERKRARTVARTSAMKLADQREHAGDLKGATAAAQRAAELDPDDEAGARRWIALLDRVGDRAGAFAAYEQFREHMSDAFGVRPSAETVALLDAVRTRREPATPRPDATSGPSVTPGASAISGPPTAAAPEPGRRRPWIWAAVALSIAVLGWIALRPERAATAAGAERSLVVLPMVDETGDPKFAYLASGIAQGIARRLDGIGGIKVRSGARSDWSDATRYDMRAIGREFGSTILLKSVIRRVGDSLEVRASVVDAGTGEERAVADHRFSTTGIRDAESKLAADIAGAVFRAPMPALARIPDRALDPESYRLMLEGWHQFLSNVQPRGLGEPTRHKIAGDLFQRAVNADPLNARAWSGLSSVWGSQAVTNLVPFDEGYDRASAAATRALVIDSMQGTAWANLAIMRALKYRNLAAGMEFLRKAEAAEPSNPEIFLIKSVLLRSAHLYDDARDAIRVARRLDPLTSFYVSHEANVEFCADRPEAALELLRSELAVNPSDRLTQTNLTRALAMLGRYDEAIASWRRVSLVAGDTTLAIALAAARGRDGYWKVKHAEGRKVLASLERENRSLSPVRRATAEFAAGDANTAFNALDRSDETYNPEMYRLSCLPAVDEFRNTARFKAALARIGALPVR